MKHLCAVENFWELDYLFLPIEFTISGVVDQTLDFFVTIDLLPPRFGMVMMSRGRDLFDGGTIRV